MTTARPIPLRLVASLFRDLTEAQQQLIRAALGRIPTDELQGNYDELWQDYAAGRVACFNVTDPAGGTVAVSFFLIETLRNGRRDFVSLASVAVDRTQTHLTDDMMPQLEQVAAGLGCDSISLRTVRPGLANVLVEKLGWFASEIILRKQLQP